MIRFDPVATYAAAHPDGPAVTDLESGRHWSYAELDRAVDRLAAWLSGEFGPNSAVDARRESCCRKPTHVGDALTSFTATT
jgi:acyl-CoA synthetase (AMP-forming)/AMP-acid ligase II